MCQPNFSILFCILIFSLNYLVLISQLDIYVIFSMIVFQSNADFVGLVENIWTLPGNFLFENFDGSQELFTNSVYDWRTAQHWDSWVVRI